MMEAHLQPLKPQEYNTPALLPNPTVLSIDNINVGAEQQNSLMPQQLNNDQPMMTQQIYAPTYGPHPTEAIFINRQ